VPTARRSATRAAAAAALLPVALVAACSSSSSGGKTTTGSTPTSSSSSGGGQAAGACKLTNPPTSGAQAPSNSTSTAKASGKVGVILPDTTSSTRYTLYDKPLLQKALSAAGITPDIQNAGGSTARFQAIAQSMIGEGVKVLIIDSIDATSGAAVEKEASNAGI
jgi:D-xylose transport system substrate-binding protein